MRRNKRSSIINRRRSVKADHFDSDVADIIDDDLMEMGNDGDDLKPIEVKRKPKRQEQLEDYQLNETYTKVITATDPNVSKSITRFNYTDRCFKLEQSVDHLAVHFSMDGVLIHNSSEEAREQQDLAALLDIPDVKDSDNSAAGVGGGAQRQLKNQFNFSERASQTFNNPMRDREVATEPPPTSEFSAQVTAWEIFDTYLEDLQRTMAAKHIKENKKGGVSWGEKEGEGDDDDEITLSVAVTDETKSDDVFNQESFARALKIMERMVNQNAEAAYFHNYKFYEEDKQEHKREDGRGAFLPLWRFTYDQAKRKTVTSIVWNPEYTDLFAVGYGSYDFMKQGPGLICCYTLKNTSHPEYVFTTNSGVMCLDFHPQHSALLVAGLYDGTVCVFDVRSKSNQPIYISSDPKVKHTDPVWQVGWQESEVGKNINFFSISSDGRVTNWIMNKNELVNEEVIEIKLSQGDGQASANATGANADADSEGVVGLAGGSCFDFNKSKGTNRHLFVVGTEEGSIHSYSKAYNSQYLRSFEGHHMAVYTVKWNPYHPNVFLSCSADWTVKLWEVNTPNPIMTFDLNRSVGDVAWAPFSSTIFACITTDGKLRLYDLNVNKHEPIGETRVNKKANLTHIAFNPNGETPIICVGDDRGVVNILKLTRNLRKMSAPKVEDIETAVEIEKLEKLLIMPDDPQRQTDPLQAIKLQAQLPPPTNVEVKVPDMK